MKGSERNAPCPCGSGTKAKRCHPEGYPPARPLVLLPPERVVRDRRKERAVNAVMLAAVMGRPIR